MRRWLTAVFVVLLSAAGTAAAADPALVAELDSLVPVPSLVGTGVPVGAAADGGDAVVAAVLAPGDPGAPALQAVMASLGAQVTATRTRSLAGGASTTSLAVAFPAATGARAAVRRTAVAVLAVPGATTGLAAELENTPGGRIEVAVMPDGSLRTLAIASRGSRLVATVVVQPSGPPPDLVAVVAGIDQAWGLVSAPAPGPVDEAGVSDAMRLALRAAWAVQGHTGTELGGSILAARVDGVLWAMADMGLPGAPDTEIFRGLPGGAFRAEGAVAVPAGCPAIPSSLRDVWGFASECPVGDAGVPLPGTTVPGTLPEPVRGVGQWIWELGRSERSLTAIVDRARRNGVRTVFIKSGDGRSYWSQFDRAVGPLRAAGLRVCGWQYVRGRAPEAEAAVAARAVAAGADCFVIDAEGEFETLPGRYARAARYMRALRARVGSAYPVGLTSFAYVDLHGAFPYSAFLGGVDGASFTMPQVYWRAFRRSPAVALERTLRWNRIYGVAIAPIGGTYLGEPVSQIRMFRCLAQSAGVEGTSWWSWQHTRGWQWGALGRPLACGQAAMNVVTRYPVIGPRARGDAVRRLQALLRVGDTSVPLNGAFGPRTSAALSAYRSMRGLPQGASTDDGTWADLLATAGSAPTPVAGAAG